MNRRMPKANQKHPKVSEDESRLSHKQIMLTTDNSGKNRFRNLFLKPERCLSLI